MSTLHTVTSAAALLSVSPSHLRRTADDMAGILPDYQPLPGQARKFSDNDLRTLQALFTRLETTPGLTRAQLLRELSEKDSSPLIIPDTLPTKAPSSPPDSPGRAIPAQAIQTDVIDSQTALQAFADVRSDMRQIIAPLSTLPATLDSLQARIDALESRPQSQTAPARPDSLSLLSAAVAVGVLIGALVAAAVWDNSAAVVVCVAVALVAVLVSIVAPLRR